MHTNAWVQLHPLNNLAGIQPMQGRIGIQFIEICDAHSQIGIGEQLDSLGLGAVRQQHLDIFLDGPFAQ